MLHICIICILIVLPYRPQVRHAHQTGSCRPVIQEDPEFQDRQAEDVQLHERGTTEEKLEEAIEKGGVGGVLVP